MNSKIHLIDLAGSEAVRKTNASGERMNEAKHINKSLSALGNVIYALTAHVSKNNINGAEAGMNGLGSDVATDDPDGMYDSRRSTHVPYRDSKLTRLLQDSLGGNAKTVLILAIAASRIHMQESINTLKFGERARQLTTKPTANTDIVLDERKLRIALAHAEQKILALTETLMEFTQGNVNAGVKWDEELGLDLALNRNKRPGRDREYHGDIEQDHSPESALVAAPAPEFYVCTMCAEVLKTVEEVIPLSSLTNVVNDLAPKQSSENRDSGRGSKGTSKPTPIAGQVNSAVSSSRQLQNSSSSAALGVVTASAPPLSVTNQSNINNADNSKAIVQRAASSNSKAKGDVPTLSPAPSPRPASSHPVNSAGYEKTRRRGQEIDKEE